MSDPNATRNARAAARPLEGRNETTPSTRGLDGKFSEIWGEEASSFKGAWAWGVSSINGSFGEGTGKTVSYSWGVCCGLVSVF